MKTRQQYLNGEISHREYYAQFIVPAMVDQVRNEIGLDRIKASTDAHFNDIPEKHWDLLSGHYFRGSEMIGRIKVLPECLELLRQADEGVSSATLTCIYKEIARQLVENKLN